MRTSCFWKKTHFKLALAYNDLGNVPRLVNQMHYCKPTKIPFILSKSKQIKVFKSFVVSIYFNVFILSKIKSDIKQKKRNN
jgi:hypothetical protein